MLFELFKNKFFINKNILDIKIKNSENVFIKTLFIIQISTQRQ
jgi:hypothetical protein